MKSTTLMDLGRHTGAKAVEAVELVAQLIDDPNEKVVLHVYASGMVCAALVVACVEAEREHNSVVDEAFIRGIMADVTNHVVGGVLLGEKMRAEKDI